ncbi:MAG TPA: hypothetical protein VIZ69_11495 [Thermoanaerobaculia bacterium]
MRSEKDLIGEALGDLQKAETIERALGRILRRHGQTYAEYLRIMDVVREVARREKVSTIEAARKIAQA